jgi:hypothetical protein
MSGAKPPLPQYAFMAWCSVKAHGQLYFTFIFNMNKIKINYEARCMKISLDEVQKDYACVTVCKKSN